MAPTTYGWLSLATSFVALGLKFWAYALTGSVGLLSDAIETIVNVVAALVAIATLSYAGEKPDAEHNFGHEKAQYFSSGIEGALIFVAAGAIVWTAIPRLLAPQPLEQIGVGLAISVVAALANAACAFAMLRGARAHRSITLEADARHLLTDVWTTVGVLVGVLAVWLTGWQRLDPIVAIAVALQVLWTGWHLMSRSFQGLMDFAIPDEDRAEIVAVLETVKAQGGDYHKLRSRIAGAKSFVDVHVLVPGRMSVQEGHDLVESLERAIEEKLPHVEMLIHMEPLEDPRSWDDPAQSVGGQADQDMSGSRG